MYYFLHTQKNRQTGHARNGSIDRDRRNRFSAMSPGNSNNNLIGVNR